MQRSHVSQKGHRFCSVPQQLLSGKLLVRAGHLLGVSTQLTSPRLCFPFLRRFHFSTLFSRLRYSGRVEGLFFVSFDFDFYNLQLVWMWCWITDHSLKLWFEAQVSDLGDTVCARADHGCTCGRKWMF